MNEREKGILMKLDVKTSNICEDIKGIKKDVSDIKDTISKNKTELEVLKTDFENCKESHEKGQVNTRSWLQWIPSAVAVIVAIVALAIKTTGV